MRNILLKNVIDACIAALAWWSIGNSFAYGNESCEGNGFIGAGNFFSSTSSVTNNITYFASWFFGYGFCATASTIVSGAVAERAQFRAYLVYTTLISSFVYPVIVHWVWSTTGWLSARRLDCATGVPSPLFAGTNGVMDFAGSGVVHMVGGSAALVSAAILGPRIGRFAEGGHMVLFENSNSGQMVLGTLILWVGWYGFNAGSTGCMLGCMPAASLAATNTTLSIASGGLTCLLAAVLLGSPGDIGVLLNGILSGAVAITASCALVEPYAAVVIGIIAGMVYLLSSKLLIRLRIDDPLDAAPVHLFCGSWGVLASGLFAMEDKVVAVYGYAEGWGAFYGGGGKQFGVQLLGVVAIAGWGFFWAAILFWGLRIVGWLRVSKDAELQGLDTAQVVGSGRLLACIQDRLATKD